MQVVGGPDPKYGEEACAWIRLRDGDQATTEEIREFCRGQIAQYKIPRHVRFVDAFLMTITGKNQEFLMRQQMVEELVVTEQDDMFPGHDLPRPGDRGPAEAVGGPVRPVQQQLDRATDPAACARRLAGRVPRARGGIPAPPAAHW